MKKQPIAYFFPHHFLSKEKRSVENKDSGLEKNDGYATSQN